MTKENEIVETNDMNVLDQIKEAVEELAAAFEAYKKANDERLAAVENGADGGEEAEKMAKLEKRMSDLEAKKSSLEAKMNRPGKPVENSEYNKKFADFMRKGIEFDTKAMSVGSNADGGYTVPDDIAKTIYDLMTNDCPMRKVSNVISVNTPNYFEIVGIHGGSTGWVTETAARPETNTPKFARIQPVWGELYSTQLISQNVLDDSMFDLESYIAKEVSGEMAITENAAFTVGAGASANSPIGFLAGPTAATADKTRAFGTIQHIAASASTFDADGSGDILFDLVGALKPAHYNNAMFMFNRGTLTTIRKFKDKNNVYLYQPSLALGVPGTLLGFPVVINDDMPDVGSNALAVAFGNFKNGFTIVDRTHMTVLRDPYSSKPNVQFYFTKRVGSMLRDSEAIKVIKFGA